MPHKIFAVDPGGTSGWAIWNNGVVTAGQLEFDPFVEMVDLLDGLDVIVAERFTISARTVKMSQQTTALEVIGYLRAIAHLERIPFVLQTPADAKRFAQVDNDAHARLDLLGWTQRPLAKHDHANDALRHLMLYMVKNRLIEAPTTTTKAKCKCEQMGNGVISGNDGRLPPAGGCPRHG